jgi:hypothetical protein
MKCDMTTKKKKKEERENVCKSCLCEKQLLIMMVQEYDFVRAVNLKIERR